MKITRNNESDKSAKCTGYTIRLSATETRAWASRAGTAWPCSTLSGKRIFAAVDGNGLYDVHVNGSSRAAEHIDGREFDAMISDHQPDDIKHLYPRWDIA